MSEVSDRRQRAREAYYDSTARRQAPEGSAVALEDAIEVATQAKITRDVTTAALEALDGWDPASSIETVIEAAFRAAGFEVVE